MSLEEKQTDLGRINELMRIVNGTGCAPSISDTKKLFTENDIYRRTPQEVTILGNTHKHKCSFLKRMKAKMQLYEIYYENEDKMIKNSIINEIGNPSIFYLICNSLTQ